MKSSQDFIDALGDLPPGWTLTLDPMSDQFVLALAGDDKPITLSRAFIEDHGFEAAIEAIKAMVRERIKRYARGEHEH